MNQTVQIFKSKNTPNNGFGCFLTFEETLNFESKAFKSQEIQRVASPLSATLCGGVF